MPRVARTVVSDCPLHVVQRGINRNACFFLPSDYWHYLRDLATFSARFGCSVHAYCLMTNHVHLLLTPGAPDSCSLLMKHLGQCHVQRINRRLGKTGTLWEGRYRSCLVASESYIMTCYRYIDLNPVRAGMVGAPEEYRWSSYAGNAGITRLEFVRPHDTYEALGLDREQRGTAYRQLCQSELPAPIVEEIRKATRIGCVAGTRRRGRGRPWAK
ncbi:MAG: transposase [Burkholderiales bacterium]